MARIDEANLPSKAIVMDHVEDGSPVENRDDAAAGGADDEINMSLKEAFRTHRPAMLWAMAISLQGIMEGYNISLVGALVAAPAYVISSYERKDPC